jgi:ATP-dependent DNA ligase
MLTAPPGAPSTYSTTARPLFAAVERGGFEGMVAKRLSERYRPGERRWIKIKNRRYWRYAGEAHFTCAV